MTRQGKRSFIPRDKPKSWIVLTIACLSALAFGLVSVLLGSALGSSTGKFLGAALSGCFLTALVSAFVYMRGLFTGRYRNLQARPWREQVW